MPGQLFRGPAFFHDFEIWEELQDTTRPSVHTAKGFGVRLLREESDEMNGVSISIARLDVHFVLWIRVELRFNVSPGSFGQYANCKQDSCAIRRSSVHNRNGTATSYQSYLLDQ